MVGVIVADGALMLLQETRRATSSPARVAETLNRSVCPALLVPFDLVPKPPIQFSAANDAAKPIEFAFLGDLLCNP